MHPILKPLNVINRLSIGDYLGVLIVADRLIAAYVLQSLFSADEG